MLELVAGWIVATPVPFLHALGSKGMATCADSCRQVLRAYPPRESRPAGAVVGMHVGVDDVGDRHALVGGEGDAGIRVLLVRIDDGAFAERCAAKRYAAHPLSKW